MALSRVKTWVAGDTLTAADLNAEFNNTLNNPISLISPTTGAINFNLQAHTNFVIQNLTSDPAVATTGRLYLNTATKQMSVDDGTIIRVMPTVSATASIPGALVTVSSSEAQKYQLITPGTSGQVLTLTSSGMPAVWAAPSASGTLSGFGSTGTATYYTSTSSGTLAGEATVLYATAFGLATGGTAAANTTAMNSAIAAFNASTHGATLILPNGSFNINACNAFTKGGVVQGGGMAGSSAGGTRFVTTANPLFSVTGDDGITFRGVYISGATVAISFNPSSANVNVWSRILDCHFNACATCLSLTDVQSMTIARCKFDAFTTAAISITTPVALDSADITIYDNQFYATGGSSIKWVSGGGVNMYGNRFLASGAGITHFNFVPTSSTDTSDMMITHNQIEGATDYGIYFSATSGGTISNICITGNELAGATTPIYLNSSNIQGVVLSGNVIAAGPAGTTYLKIQGADQVAVSANLFRGNGGANVAIAVTSSAGRVEVGTNAYASIGRSITSLNSSTYIYGLPQMTCTQAQTSTGLVLFAAAGSHIFLSDAIPSTGVMMNVTTSAGGGAPCYMIVSSWWVA